MSSTPSANKPPRVGVLDSVELLVYAIAAVTLMIGVLLLGIRAAHRLVGPAGSAAAALSGVVVLAALTRDVKRKAWSVASIAFAGAYGACLVGVFYLEFRSF